MTWQVFVPAVAFRSGLVQPISLDWAPLQPVESDEGEVATAANESEITGNQ